VSNLSSQTSHDAGRSLKIKKPGANLSRLGILFLVSLFVVASPDNAFAKRRPPSPTPAPAAVMVSPVPGSIFSGSTVTFQWGGGKASAYTLTLGSDSGGGDIYSSNALRTTSATVTGIPTDGRTVYATLYSHIRKSWVSNSYTYQAFNGSPTPTPTPTPTVSPTPTPTATPTPTPSPTPTATPTATPTPTPGGSPTSADASRFLIQSTFGPSSALIAQVQQTGFSNFLNQQFTLPPTRTLPRVDATDAALPPDPTPFYSDFQEAWWYTVVTAPDQVRQRVAFALSEILVISANGNSMIEHPEAMATYWDLLANDAFGNFRQLIEDVTLNPAMGDYLDMAHNDKPNQYRNTEPNENYARELMQLFTIGLYKLNQDGSQQLDANHQPIPTYDQDVVEGYAHVFTGWYWAQTGTPTWYYVDPNYRDPMMAFPTHHDTGAKLILNGVTLPAGQTQAQDLQMALDSIFNHPNVGPFVGKQLIQKLVTSNPSPPYIARVAAAFANNGQGVRGDMKAVLRAIFLDPEARDTSAAITNSGFGHEREPLVRLANLYRAFNASATSGKFIVNNVESNFSQAPLYAPSVFNFFSPFHSQVGPIENAGLVAPEFQITTDNTVISSANMMRRAVYRGTSSTNPDAIVLDLSAQSALASNPGALVDSLNILLMGGQMSSSMRSIIVNAVTQISAASTLERAQTAVHLIVTSPEFVIQK
jgi:uncharacterized protein (DUF1800 family)